MDDSLRIIDFVRGYKQISNVRRIPIALLKSKGGDIPIIGNAEIDKYKLRIRGKEYMSDDTMHKLFSSEVVVEEKVDGHPVVVLYGGYTFFCESLKIQHTVDYEGVPYSEMGWPDMVVCYEIMEGEQEPPYHAGQGNGKWLSRSEKETLCSLVGAPLVPLVFKGRVTPEQLPALANRLSGFGKSKIEGIVIKNLDKGVFGKFVNVEFHEAITDEALWGGVHPEQRGIRNIRKFQASVNSVVSNFLLRKC